MSNLLQLFCNSLVYLWQLSEVEFLQYVIFLQIFLNSEHAYQRESLITKMYVVVAFPLGTSQVAAIYALLHVLSFQQKISR